MAGVGILGLGLRCGVSGCGRGAVRGLGFGAWGVGQGSGSDWARAGAAEARSGALRVALHLRADDPGSARDASVSRALVEVELQAARLLRRRERRPRIPHRGAVLIRERLSIIEAGEEHRAREEGVERGFEKMRRQFEGQKDIFLTKQLAEEQERKQVRS